MAADHLHPAVEAALDAFCTPDARNPQAVRLATDAAVEVLRWAGRNAQANENRSVDGWLRELADEIEAASKETH